MRAAIYIRVSDPKQEPGTSLETQEAQARKYALGRGYRIVEVYREVYTGSELHERKVLTAARLAAKRGEFDVLICYALDRLSRDQVHVAIVYDDLDRANVKLEFVTEQFEDGPVGKFIMNAKAFAAELERGKIKERTQRGIRARVDAGRLIHGSKIRYGYRPKPGSPGHLEIDPLTAPTVIWMFEQAASGWSLRQIAKELTARGIPCAKGYGSWVHANVCYYLSQPIYAGRAAAYRYERIKSSRTEGKFSTRLRPPEQHVQLPDAAPALVSLEVFEAVQAKLQTNRVRMSGNPLDREVALLRGGFARCGYCENTLIVVRQKGTQYVYVCCKGQGSRECERFGISVNILDKMVWDKVRSILLKPEIIRKGLEQLQEEDPISTDISAVDRLLADVGRRQTQTARAISMLESDDPDAAQPLLVEMRSLADRKRALLAEKEAIGNRRQQWEATQAQLQELEEWCNDIAQKVERLSWEEKRIALEALGIAVKVWRQDHKPQRVWIGSDLRFLDTMVESMTTS
jgi:site-specific DNA recombinase